MTEGITQPKSRDPNARWDLLAPELGLNVDHLARLIERLSSDISAEDWGFAQLVGISDLRTRAVVSDQIRGAADAVATNLFEVRLHEETFNELVSPEGFQVPTTLHEHLDGARRSMHLVGFFRAVGSVLDCLAAVAIGVLRIPRSIRRASFVHVRELEPSGIHPGPWPSDQTAAWGRFRRLLDAHRVAVPPGWLDWSLEVRHAMLHRERSFTPSAARERASQLLIRADDFPMYAFRFDPLLVARPWLPDMMLLPQENLEDAWLTEPACLTLQAVRLALNDLTEAAASQLHETWDEVAKGKLEFKVDSSRWTPEPEPEIVFKGLAPGTIGPPKEMMISPADLPRIHLAERLRNLGRDSEG